LKFFKMRITTDGEKVILLYLRILSMIKTEGNIQKWISELQQFWNEAGFNESKKQR